uniref:DUF223 domain-containing protein n=1 Tax=Brassica oleracea TaxID=3712 RepID=A0A3P6D0P3_BRAOL|nr:unnamed protein product [Brassica oleracea]
MPSLKAGSIVKVDRFEVSRCSSMYKITVHPFLIRFISLTIIDEVITGAPGINLQSRLDYVVGQIRSVQGSGLTKETTRIVMRLLIDPSETLASSGSFKDYVIHGFTPVKRANHYMPSLKADSIVKVDRFEVARCSSMYKITDHPFLIRFISLTIIDEVITGAPEINFQSRLDCSTISK